MDMSMRHTLLGLFLLASLFSGNAQVKYLFEKPTAILRPISYEIPLGGYVTLSCSVEDSDNWTILWYRGSNDEPMTEYEGKKAINVSQSGVYSCRGRSDSGRLTYKSDYAIIKDTLPITAIITIQPKWTQIYMGETFTVRCEIPGGEGTYWSYDWRPKRFTTYYTTNERTFHNVGWEDNGNYQCRGNKGLSLTQWSNVIPVNISFTLRPVLTVSPSWLSPGASVNLSCEVEYPSEGWLFSWYKAVPYYKIKEEPYTYELLPDGSKTAQSFYIINGQTSTAGYVCRVERGSNFYHKYYSDPKFVWSADVNSAASLTVGPVVQNFGYDSVKLTCKGNSPSWRVRKFPENSVPYCSNFWNPGESADLDQQGKNHLDENLGCHQHPLPRRLLERTGGTVRACPGATPPHALSTACESGSFLSYSGADMGLAGVVRNHSRPLPQPPVAVPGHQHAPVPCLGDGERPVELPPETESFSIPIVAGPQRAVDKLKHLRPQRPRHQQLREILALFGGPPSPVQEAIVGLQMAVLGVLLHGQREPSPSVGCGPSSSHAPCLLGPLSPPFREGQLAWAQTDGLSRAGVDGVLNQPHLPAVSGSLLLTALEG
ncbi:uncharacterized protein LOC120433989 [Oreochromis aureus]|uniref:uncharacterized protein LOC120433989 n=1 Tax=Oreochromis aureus TaxID=47969 RepID=UPI0019536E38|nr:uncharacterized protein LOC120433989 [Oreochromis aureus]